MSSAGTDVHDVHGEKFVARVPVVADRRVVDREELQGLDVEDPHRLRIGLEQQPVAPIGLARLVEDVAGADREGRAVAQLPRVAQVLLAEDPGVLPAHPQRDHARRAARSSPQRDLEHPGGLERAVQLPVLVVLGHGAQQLLGHLHRRSVHRRGQAEGNPPLAMLAEDANQEVAGGIAVRAAREDAAFRARRSRESCTSRPGSAPARGPARAASPRSPATRPAWSSPGRARTPAGRGPRPRSG